MQHREYCGGAAQGNISEENGSSMNVNSSGLVSRSSVNFNQGHNQLRDQENFAQMQDAHFTYHLRNSSEQQSASFGVATAVNHSDPIINANTLAMIT